MKTIVRWLSGFLIGMILPLAPLRGQVPADSFKVGVAPHTSARFILEQYQPLRTYLSKALGVEVEIVTAPDFTEFARQAVGQKYDIAITTGHQARMLQMDASYLPLLTYKAEFKALVVVRSDAGIKDSADLKSKTIIGLSPSSLVTLWGESWLRRMGRTDVTLRYVSAADSVGQLLLVGEGSAGLMSLPNFQNLAPEVKAKLRVLAESPAMAGRVYMLNGRQRKRQAALEAALWAFSKTPDGMHYLEKNNLGGYRKLRRGELEAMSPYAIEVRKILGLK